MFDVVEVNFKKFFDGINKYQDLEELLRDFTDFVEEIK